jgi:membrane fusion protein, multidrug efflux system
MFYILNNHLKEFSLSLIFVLLLSLLTLSSCGEKQAPTTTEQVPEVAVVTIEARDIPLQIEFIGQTKGAVDAEVRARVEGILQGIHFEEGKDVTEGQLLYTIDPAPFQAKLSEAQAKLIEAETRLVKAEADLGRIRPLAEMNAVSKRDLDTAIAMQGVAKSAVDVAKAGVDIAQIDLSYTKIQAPITGIIGLTKARVGEFVGKPPNAVLLNTVSKIDPIHVRFSVTEQDYLYFARARQQREKEGGQAPDRKIELILADNSKHPEAGVVSSADSQIDPTTGSLAIEASFANPGKVIRPGQYAKIKAQKELLNGVIVVPKKALRELQGLKQLQLVTTDDKIEFRTVTVKADLGDQLVIDQGVAVGDRVVLELQQRLKSGSLVRPISVASAPAVEAKSGNS